MGTAGASPTAEVIGPLAVHLHEPLVVIDIGGLDGAALSWATFDPKTRLICFATDPAARRSELGTDRMAVAREFLPLRQLESLDGWIADTSDANLPHVLELGPIHGERGLLGGAERSLVRVRALRAQLPPPEAAEIDACLRGLGFLLWRRQAGAGIYVRDEMAASSERRPWRQSLRDACVAGGLGLTDLAETSLSAALGSAPAYARPGMAAALADLHRDATGRARPGTEVERLRSDLDWARREVERLRARPGYRAYDRIARAMEVVSARMDFVRRRLRHWTQPRIGVLRQHPPQPLRVPRRQLRLHAPPNAPTIALVTPSFNQGPFVERTIRSVLAQDYPRLEYVVRDGGSTDATPAILDRYRDELHACVSEPDDGQADAINRGFAVTSGEVMGWVNSDDVLLPGALAAVGKHFAGNPDTDVVYGHRLLIDEQDRQIGSWVMPRHASWTLDYADLIPQETLFWRRSLWDEVGGLDIGYQYALDWDLLLRFRDAGARFVRLPVAIGGFRLHDAQKTTGQLDHGLYEMEQIRAQRLPEPMTHGQAWRALRPYLRRHVASHTLYRLRMRIPQLRHEVEPAR